MLKPESTKEPSANSQSPAKPGGQHLQRNLALGGCVHTELQGLVLLTKEENTFCP